ncbi:hypothetical protein [Streptomyces sp. NPDC088736]
MDELVVWLRLLPRSIADGFAALRDLLFWGHVYPRAVRLESLQRMRRRP